MVNNHTHREFLAMRDLIYNSLKELYVYYEIGDKSEADSIASHLISKYSTKIHTFLDKPHGGTFSPEEIAEMILVNEYRLKNTTEEASTLVN